MKVTFLGSGTSQGVPMIGCHCKVCSSTDTRDKRLRSSVLISCGNTNIVIDSGPDFRYQMLRGGVENLDAILFTHEHKDHTGGLDDVRAYNYILKKSIDIYAEERVANVLKKDFDYAFAPNPYPGVPRIDLNIIEPYKPFTVRGVEVIPLRGYHYKLPVMGYRIGGLCYITDMNSICQESLDMMQGLDTLIINALRKEDHLSHFTLAQALEVVEKLKPNRCYLTHISHHMGLYKEIEPTLPHGVFQAYDTLCIESK